MNHLALKSSSRIIIGGKPMMLLPLGIYEKITKNLEKLNSKNTKKNTPKTNLAFSTTISESSLAKDWLKLVEEKTWKNL
ncbi:MAG TPA: hypothetical protein DCS23_03270 [Candidatus Yonathbacteria bacterium]|nr:hypothetical protein [Candidatus Yonathbacteria bacterium]